MKFFSLLFKILILGFLIPGLVISGLLISYKYLEFNFGGIIAFTSFILICGLIILLINIYKKRYSNRNIKD